MPYIPEKHKKYDLLPLCRKSGGEVFEYPSKLIEEVEELIGFSEEFYPYGYHSYEEYFLSVDNLIKSYSHEPIVAEKLARLKNMMEEMNRKEDWSILRYMGATDDFGFRLTEGRNYYWPTQKSNPVYCGVIDDEEFTAYLYPTEADMWEILEDPTGMAYRTIYREGNASMSKDSYQRIMAEIGKTLEELE